MSTPTPHTELSCQPHPTHFCNNRAYRMSTFLCNLGRWDDAWKESWSPVATGMFAMQAIIMSGHLHSMNLDIRSYNGPCNTATKHIAEHLPRNHISRKSQPLTHTESKCPHFGSNLGRPKMILTITSSTKRSKDLQRNWLTRKSRHLLLVEEVPPKAAR